MSSSRIHDINCQSCDTINKVRIWDSVNVTIDPELKNQVLDGTLNEFTCNNCGNQTRIISDYLYHDMDKKFFIYLVQQEKPQATMTHIDHMQKLMFPYKKLRTVKDYYQLIEKINIFENSLDDYSIELIKIIKMDNYSKHLDGDPLFSISNKMFFFKLDAEEGGPKDDLVFVFLESLNKHRYFKIPYEDYSKCAETIKILGDGFIEKIKLDNQIVNTKFVHDLISNELFDGKPYKQWQDIITIEHNTLTGSDGSIYIGDCYNGKPHGQGTMTTPDGIKHVGEFKNGYPHGQGTMRLSGKWSLSGLWENGKLNGKGFYTSGSGEEYDGDFVNSKYHGRGTYKYTDGSIYTGDWDMGKRHGHGILTRPDGYNYNGPWQNDKRVWTTTDPKTWATDEQIAKFSEDTDNYRIEREMKRRGISREEAKQLVEDMPI